MPAPRHGGEGGEVSTGDRKGVRRARASSIQEKQKAETVCDRMKDNL